MMMLMMLGCMGMAVLFYVIPSGWFSDGIGILLLIMLLFACCIPMIKMMMGTEEEKS